MMLAKQGILTDDEKQQILDGLESIRRDVESGSLRLQRNTKISTVFVEANLIDRIGDAGKKLHTGRSRNDQVALDMKLIQEVRSPHCRDWLWICSANFLRS